MTYIPQISVVEYIDEYVTAIFKCEADAVHNTCPQDLKDRAYSIIPDKSHTTEHTNRVVAAGVIYCALILCDSRMSREQLQSAAKCGGQLRYLSVVSISKAARFVRASNKLDIIW